MAQGEVIEAALTIIIIEETTMMEMMVKEGTLTATIETSITMVKETLTQTT